MQTDGYLNSKCAITVNHFVASSAVFFVLFLHSVFDHVCIVLVGIKGHQSFYQGLSCTFHIIKDLTGKHSTEFVR